MWREAAENSTLFCAEKNLETTFVIIMEVIREKRS